MRMRNWLIASAIIISSILTCHTYAQAPPSPVWYKVVTESGYLSTTGPVSLRFGTGTGTTSTGVDCSQPAGCWAPITLVSNMPQTYIDCCWSGKPDPAPGLVKEVDVAEGNMMQSVGVNGAVMIVPALPPPPPPPSYPPVSFVVGSHYFMVVQNIPPVSPASALQGLFSIRDGEKLIAAFSCVYNVTESIPTPIVISGTPPELAAVFGCIPLPLPSATPLSK